MRGNHVLIEPTFNTADAASESTPDDTLLALLRPRRNDNAFMSG